MVQNADTTKAIIYAYSAEIYFTIKDKKKFSFKNHILQSPGRPQMSYLPKEMTVSKKKNNQRRKEEQGQAAIRRVLSCTKGDPTRPRWGKCGFVLVFYLAGCNQFELPSLPDSEKLD
jgi:hypothetical protein